MGTFLWKLYNGPEIQLLLVKISHFARWDFLSKGDNWVYPSWPEIAKGQNESLRGVAERSLSRWSGFVGGCFNIFSFSPLMSGHPSGSFPFHSGLLTSFHWNLGGGFCHSWNLPQSFEMNVRIHAVFFGLFCYTSGPAAQKWCV